MQRATETDTSGPSGSDVLLKHLVSEETARPGHLSTAQQYRHAYKSLSEWIYSSLDIYRNELIQVLYPVFVHCYFELVNKGFRNEGGCQILDTEIDALVYRDKHCED